MGGAATEGCSRSAGTLERQFCEATQQQMMAGGVHAVVDVMNPHRGSEDVQAADCEVRVFLAEGHAGNKAAAVAAGGVEAAAAGCRI